MPTGPQAAQNQHYVPKFVLRNFLIDERREKVAVFSKRTGEVFTPSIRGIMAERRFHEFVLDGRFRASYEEAICRLEDFALPVYRRIVEEERLTGEAEERAMLGFLMAFQFIRTRAQRDQFRQLEELLASKLERMGASMEDVGGWEPLTDDRLAHQHIEMVRDAIPQFGAAIACKDFLLLKAPEGRAFYLSDNPVALHNMEPAHPLWGNIGLSVEGIEIYMPLSPSLTLAAWCPSLLDRIREGTEEARRGTAAQLLVELQAGRLSPLKMRIGMGEIEKMLEPATAMLDAVDTGNPLTLQPSNVDYCNSLQVRWAREFVICQKQDFDLAKRMRTETPNSGPPRLRDATA